MGADWTIEAATQRAHCLQIVMFSIVRWRDGVGGRYSTVSYSMYSAVQNVFYSGCIFHWLKIKHGTFKSEKGNNDAPAWICHRMTPIRLALPTIAKFVIAIGNASCQVFLTLDIVVSRVINTVLACVKTLTQTSPLRDNRLRDCVDRQTAAIAPPLLQHNVS